MNLGKFKSNSNPFLFQLYKCFKKGNLNVWQTCHDLFKISGYLYGSEAITYLNAFLWVVTEPALWVIRLPPPPTTGNPPPSQYGSITFTNLEEFSSMVKLPYLWKSKGKTCMVEELSHLKQLSLNHVCKIGLTHWFYRGHYLGCWVTLTLFTQGARGRGLTAKFLTHSFHQGHYLPCSLTPLYQPRSLFTLHNLLPCFCLYQGHYLH